MGRKRRDWRSRRNIEWVHDCLRVPEGRYVGQPLRLRPMQVKLFKGIYDTPTRRCILSVGRKNTKTATAAVLALLHLAGPEYRQNSQLASAAQSKDQAGFLFSLAAKMVRMSPELAPFVTVRDHIKELFCRELGTLYKALSAEASTAYGASPVFLVHDELGQVRGPRSELYDALETAMGAHEDPLSIVISTQAPTDADLLSELIDDAAKGTDPRTKLFLWTAPVEDDPFDERTWRKANPMLGDILNIEEVRDAAERARRMPSSEAAFRNLVLNQRVDRTTPLIPRSVWQACGGDPEPEVLRTRRSYWALDLSARNDLTALAGIAQDDEATWHAHAEHFAPEAGLRERARRDRAPYDAWARDGWLTTTPGASVDYEVVAQRLVEVFDDYAAIEVVAFDRWRIDVLIKELERLGARSIVAKLLPFGQGFRDMGPAVDAVEAALMNGRVRHGGNPVLSWCASNAVATTDPAGNRKLDRSRAFGRIDGFVALTMAFGAAARQPEPKRSVYEERGLLSIRT